MTPDDRTPPPAPLTAAEARAARLQEIDGCILDCECACGRTVQPGVKMLLRRYNGQHRLGEVVPRITCQQCGAHPTIYLCQTHMRKFCYGGRPGWSVQVWPVTEDEQTLPASGPSPIAPRICPAR